MVPQILEVAKKPLGTAFANKTKHFYLNNFPSTIQLLNELKSK